MEVNCHESHIVKDQHSDVKSPDGEEYMDVDKNKTPWTREFLHLQELVHTGKVNINRFMAFFRGPSQSYVELFHATVYLNSFVQDLWERHNFKSLDMEELHGIETMLLELKDKLPFDEGNYLGKSNKNNFSNSFFS